MRRRNRHPASPWIRAASRRHPIPSRPVPWRRSPTDRRLWHVRRPCAGNRSRPSNERIWPRLRPTFAPACRRRLLRRRRRPSSKRRGATGRCRHVPREARQHPGTQPAPGALRSAGPRNQFPVLGSPPTSGSCSDRTRVYRPDRLRAVRHANSAPMMSPKCRSWPRRYCDGESPSTGCAGGYWGGATLKESLAEIVTRSVSEGIRSKILPRLRFGLPCGTGGEISGKTRALRTTAGCGHRTRPYTDGTSCPRVLGGNRLCGFVHPHVSVSCTLLLAVTAGGEPPRQPWFPQAPPLPPPAGQVIRVETVAAAVRGSGTGASQAERFCSPTASMRCHVTSSCTPIT